MTKEEKVILEGFLSKTLNMDSEAISGLFNADGELVDMGHALELDATRISKFRTDKEAQYNRGLKEGATKIEKAIKAKYSIDNNELIGVDLLDHVIELQTSELTEKLKNKGKDDDFEKSPKYLQLKQEWEKQLKTKDQEWESKLTEKESEWNRKETLGKIAKLAFNELETGYVLPENAERANALKEVLQRELESGNYKFDDSGEPILLDKEGKPIEDQHGKLVQFKEHINGLASKYFDKKVAAQRGNAGNQNQQQQSAGTYKSQDEFTEAMRNAKTPEEQAAAYQKLKASNLN